MTYGEGDNVVHCLALLFHVLRHHIAAADLLHFISRESFAYVACFAPAGEVCECAEQRIYCFGRAV
jgi:hypothetical protein